MNRLLGIAAIALGVALAGCGGNDKVTVQQAPAQQPPPPPPQQPGPGDTPNNPIVLTPDGAPFLRQSGGNQSSFFSVDVPPNVRYFIWEYPQPISVLNYMQFQLFSDPAYTQNAGFSAFVGGNTANPEYSSNFGGNPTWYIWSHPGSPGQGSQNFAIVAMTDSGTGTLVGGAPQASPPPAAPVTVNAGSHYQGTFPAAGTTHYFQAVVFNPGIHSIKLGGMPPGGPTFQIQAPAQPNVFCFTSFAPYPGMGSCVADMQTVGALITFTIDNFGNAGNYDVSVIGP